MTLATRSDADCVPARMLRCVDARPAGEVVVKACVEAARRASDARESFIILLLVSVDSFIVIISG